MNFRAKKLMCALTLIPVLSCAFAKGIFSADIPDRELCAAATGDDPFVLDIALDATLGTLALGSFTAATVIKHTASFPAYDASVVYDRSDVNGFDRWTMNPYNKAIDTTADFVLGAEVALFPVLTFGLEAAFGNLSLMPLVKIGVMYAEAYVLSLGIKNLLKMAVLRPRPYMYFDSRDEKGLSGNDWHYSWPSGHSTSAFLGATFLSYVFCTYYPGSAWKIPVVAVSYSVAAGVAALRLMSGNHYVTDVIGGALLGSLCGFSVPFLHRFVAKRKAAAAKGAAVTLEDIALVPYGFSVTVSLSGKR